MKRISQVDRQTWMRMCVGCLMCAAATVAEPVVIRPDAGNEIRFPASEARFVRLTITATQPPGEPCIDEIEIYGPEGDQNLALAESGARAAASSCLSGHAIHQITHLNDGQYGNSYSWIAAAAGEAWAQIELPQAAVVDRVVFSRDRQGQFRDRVPVAIDVLLSIYGEQGRGAWSGDHATTGWRGQETTPQQGGVVRGPRYNRG